MNKLRIAFTVDDVAPKPGYGLLLDNDPTLYLKKLNEEFGCKFTLFCIPAFEGNPQFSWENNVGWANKMKNTSYYEIAQHGLTHTAQKPEWGAQEFLGINDDEAIQRIVEGKSIFRRVGINVSGYKMPGWFIAPQHYTMLKEQGFTYVGDHFMGTKTVNQDGLIRVPYTFTINQIIHAEPKDYLVLHSHISPIGGNLNAWTKENYEEVKKYLNILHKKYDIEYIFISDMVKLQNE